MSSVSSLSTAPICQGLAPTSLRRRRRRASALGAGGQLQPRYDAPTIGRASGSTAQSESSSAAEAKEEEVASSNGEQERNFKDGGWFLQVHNASLSLLAAS